MSTNNTSDTRSAETASTQDLAAALRQLAGANVPVGVRSVLNEAAKRLESAELD